MLLFWGERDEEAGAANYFSPIFYVPAYTYAQYACACKILVNWSELKALEYWDSP